MRIPVKFYKLLAKPVTPTPNSVYFIYTAGGAGSVAEMYVTDETGAYVDPGNSAFVAIAVAAAGFAQLNSPTFTGLPAAPTAAAGTNTTQLATTAYVMAVRNALINAAPGALDTLNELALALGNDANFAATVTTALASKAPLASPALTGTPTAPTAAVATNTTQIATTAFVLANSGGGGGSGSKNYIDVTAAPYNAIPDNGTTDNTTAINAAIAAAQSGSKKRVYFPGAGYYRCDGSLSAASTNGITLFGDGGRVEPTQDVIPTSIVYTGTASKFFDAGKSHGLTIKGLGLQVSNAGFTGDILSTNFVGGGVTYSTHVEDCTIGGRTSAARFARSGLHTAGVVEMHIKRCNFGWTNYQIIGVTAGDTAFSTVVLIDACRFSQYGQWAVVPCGTDQWIIKRNIFEFRFDANPSAVSGVAGGIAAGNALLGGGGVNQGAIISENGFWDATSGAWIDIQGNGIVIENNIPFSLGSGVTAIIFRNGGRGHRVSGNRAVGSAGAKWIDLIGAGITEFVDGGNTLDAGITKYVIPSLMGMADRAATNQTANHLIAGGTAGSANTTTCPGAGTSPTVGANAQDAAGWVILTTGSSPSASSKVFNVVFNTAYANQPVSVVLTPANAAAAALSSTGQVFVAHADITTTGFSATIGSTALAAGVQYQWHYQVIGV